MRSMKSAYSGYRICVKEVGSARALNAESEVPSIELGDRKIDASHEITVLEREKKRAR